MPEPQSHNLEEIAVEKVSLVKPVLETLGIKGLLKLVEGEDRGCYFSTAMAFMAPWLEEPKIFSSGVEGEMAPQPRGKQAEHHWSELYYIFIPQGEGRTLAEMSGEEYHEWRRRASVDAYLREFAEWYVKNVQDSD